MKPHTLVRECFFNLKPKEIFDFFSNAENLNRITPPELGFKILSRLPVQMKKGTVIDYKLRLNGIPFKWKTEITAWNPPFSFTDSQISGPYRMWVHEHKFEEINGRTKMTDKVNYISPGGILEFIPHNLFVKKKAEYIFDYRTKILNEIFGNK
ncbi:MAG: SRPBCC family protein [Ignavibacteria bacterium]|nr:SRPBCC family protein [Ignavibacteria bacterium]